MASMCLVDAGRQRFVLLHELFRGPFILPRCLHCNMVTALTHSQVFSLVCVRCTHRRAVCFSNIYHVTRLVVAKAFAIGRFGVTYCRAELLPCPSKVHHTRPQPQPQQSTGPMFEANVVGLDILNSLRSTVVVFTFHFTCPFTLHFTLFASLLALRRFAANKPAFLVWLGVLLLQQVHVSKQLVSVRPLLCKADAASGEFHQGTSHVDTFGEVDLHQHVDHVQSLAEFVQRCLGHHVVIGFEKGRAKGPPHTCDRLQ